MEYVFLGQETAETVRPLDNCGYRLESLADLFNVLSDGIWRAETCAPRMRDEWSTDNRTWGQCSITAFLVQDIFGGEVYGILRPGGNYHCYNVIGGRQYDLTIAQFGDEAASLVYDDNNPQSRDVHFAKEEKYQRYLLLKELLNEARGM
ncbi:MAG: hypothetical protein IKD91_02480 [Clostridiales bacterium]|nr:hypothetical protein [Clostridiales bacterium]